jgi:hypothetical protein
MHWTHFTLAVLTAQHFDKEFPIYKAKRQCPNINLTLMADGLPTLEVYRLSQEERSIFWVVIVSVIINKKSVHVYVSYSERFPR